MINADDVSSGFISRGPPPGPRGPRPALQTPHAQVSFLACRADAREHELMAQRVIAERLAALLGCRFEDRPVTGPLGYVVPNETLTSLAAARALGINGAEDLYGGVVPFPFVATKTITHPLHAADAAAPQGWCADFAERVADVVLPGLSAYSADDARVGGRRLLREGPVRLKLASGVGGHGQSVAHDAAELDAQLAALDPAELATSGIVVERNLVEPLVTYSIGLLRIGGMYASYFGTQRSTRDRHGRAVYGGSTLQMVRGGFEVLEQAAGDDFELRRAIVMARTYHEAALQCFAGMFASRCNYDVAQGRDVAGRPLAGVLEQSWRIGGASGAEVAALEALRDDPALETVRASTVELHGAGSVVPPGATLYYAGVDPRLGPITKYAHLHDDTRTED